MGLVCSWRTRSGGLQVVAVVLVQNEKEEEVEDEEGRREAGACKWLQWCLYNIIIIAA